MDPFIITAITITFAVVIGAFLRLLYGGAPHVPDPTDVNKQLRGWLGKGPCYALFLILGLAVLVPVTIVVTWQQWLAYFLISLIVAIGWNPGHGSYLSPGDGFPDNEEVAPIVEGLTSPFGITQGSTVYCMVGMGVRYGLVSLLAAGAMILCNMYLGTSFVHWGIYATAGFLSGLGMGLCKLVKWDKGIFVQKPWLDPVYHNGPFEIIVGALMYGMLPLASLQF